MIGEKEGSRRFIIGLLMAALVVGNSRGAGNLTPFPPMRGVVDSLDVYIIHQDFIKMLMCKRMELTNARKIFFLVQGSLFFCTGICSLALSLSYI